MASCNRPIDCSSLAERQPCATLTTVVGRPASQVVPHCTMSAKSVLNKEVFAPNDERMLGAVQVRRRTRKRIPFLATGGQGDYTTYICLSVTNKKPLQGYITKVKRFEGVSSFVRRSQWTLDQLRQVNGVDGVRDCPEFDLLFDNAHDQWVAGTAAEKGSFLQSLHHTCQRHLAQRLQPDFLNCPSRILVGEIKRRSATRTPRQPSRICIYVSPSLLSAIWSAIWSAICPLLDEGLPKPCASLTVFAMQQFIQHLHTC
ncbi:syntaxin-binding protein 6-like isoform X3 [Lethenteron reissneri]|uniref:syntaxin-binding protein 6-like isoform X3 n=1 Tax=Lethenteron reissneri TaxID=7753 RepID=UPI002AB79C00|nr:syntaxin-binding protein 6-like isoform X3 [Lethenteron reissneri]